MSRTYEQLEPVISALDERIKTNLGAFPTDTAEGSIVSFPDGADDVPLKSLVVNIDPVQDLHGQDAPWPAGGGKNKIPYPYYSQAGTFDGVTYTIGDDGKLTATGTTERGTNFFFARNVALTAGTYTASIIGDFAGPTFMIYDQVNSVTICNILPAESVHYKTFTIESDTTVNIYLNTSQTGLTFNISAYFQLEQGSTATAYAPYENICPISGWTGANVTRCGKNLLPNLKFQIAPSRVGIGQTEHVSSIQKIYLSAGTYTLSTVTTASGRCYYKKKGGDNTAIGSSPQVNPNGTFTITETGFYAFWIYDANGFSTDDLISFQLEKGSTVTDYEPYNGQTIPISWQTEAGTVYGGHLDVLSGVLTVDRAMVTLDEDDIANVTVEGQICRVFVVSGKISAFDSYRDGVCNKAVIKTSWGGVRGDTNAIAINLPTSNQFAVNSAFGTTLQEIKNFVGTGLQICTYIATPIEIQLTPHDVKTLLGQNNIWADTGDTEVEYRADTKLYIERLTEPDADMIADANITSGSYFMVGNTLYKATANIASGSAVIVGTNCTQKSLSEALNEINS